MLLNYQTLYAAWWRKNSIFQNINLAPQEAAYKGNLTQIYCQIYKNMSDHAMPTLRNI